MGLGLKEWQLVLGQGLEIHGLGLQSPNRDLSCLHPSDNHSQDGVVDLKGLRGLKGIFAQRIFGFTDPWDTLPEALPQDRKTF